MDEMFQDTKQLFAEFVTDCERGFENLLNECKKQMNVTSSDANSNNNSNNNEDEESQD